MSKEREANMEASASSLPRKCSPCLFLNHPHHHRHCNHHPHHRHCNHHHHHHHGHHYHGHHVHHHHPFHYHQYSRHNTESLPDASPRMTLEQGHGFQLPPLPEEEKDEVEDEEQFFVMTDEWKEFFAKSEAKRRSERKKAKNKGRNTE